MSQSRSSGDVVSFALWLGLAGIIFRGADNHSLLYHGARLLSDISCTFLGLSGLHHILVRGRDKRFLDAYYPCFLFLAASAIAAFVGWFNDNDYIYWMLWGVLPFGSVASVVLGEREGLFRRLANTLVYQLYLVVPFAFYVIVIVRPATREEWYGPDGHSLGAVAATALSYVPFLLPYLPRLKRMHACMVVLGYIATLLLHVEGANRGGLLMCLFGWPLIVVVCGLRRDGSWRVLTSSLRPFALMLVLMAPVVNLAFAAQPALVEYVTDRFDESFHRFTGSDSKFDRDKLDLVSQQLMDTSVGEFAGEGARSKEFREFIDQMKPLDWVIGRGFGGTWMPHDFGRVPHTIVHVGFGHLLLLGGLPLVMTFCWLWYCSVRRAWARLLESDAAPGILCYGLSVTAGFLQHGVFADESGLGLFWLGIGIMMAPTPVASRLRKRNSVKAIAGPVRARISDLAVPGFNCSQNSAMFRR